MDLGDGSGSGGAGSTSASAALTVDRDRHAALVRVMAALATTAQRDGGDGPRDAAQSRALGQSFGSVIVAKRASATGSGRGRMLASPLAEDEVVSSGSRTPPPADESLPVSLAQVSARFDTLVREVTECATALSAGDVSLAADRLFHASSLLVDVPELRAHWLSTLARVLTTAGRRVEAAQCHVMLAWLVLQELVADETPPPGLPPLAAFGRSVVPALTTADPTPVVHDAVVSPLFTADGFAAELTSAASLLEAEPDQAEAALDVCGVLADYCRANFLYTRLADVHRQSARVAATVAPAMECGDDSTLPLPVFYRVSLFGKPIGRFSDTSFILREPAGTTVGDVVDSMRTIYAAHTVRVAPNTVRTRFVSGAASADDSVVTVQVASVTPCDEHGAHHKGRRAIRHPSHFLLQAPLDTREERRLATASGTKWTPPAAAGVASATDSAGEPSATGAASQWTLRVVYHTGHSLPAPTPRSLVTDTSETLLSPQESACLLLESQVSAIRAEVLVAQQRFTDAHRLRRILQGSVFPQVNAGSLELCAAFLPKSGKVTEETAPVAAVLVRLFAECRDAVAFHGEAAMSHGEAEADAQTHVLTWQAEAERAFDRLWKDARAYFAEEALPLQFSVKE
jgi:hypothetical protein